MNRILQFIKWIMIGLIALVLLIVAILYATGTGYLVKGVYVTYLHGHNTAYLDDYRFFDNHVVKTGAAQPWAESTHYNSVAPPSELDKLHETWGTVAYLVILRDSIWFEEYADGYSKSARSNSFSMAKSVVAALLGKVMEEGYIESLDQSVREFVPELTGRYADSLRLIDLVTMSSGMEWQEDYYDPFSITTQLYFDGDLVSVLPKMPINDKPGQSFSYKSGDTQVLGMALQRATGKTLSELMSDYFWAPMGAQEDALWQVDSEKKGIEKAYCCLASNARDFARFGKLYLQDGYWNGQSLLDSAYVAQSIRPYFDDNSEYGYGWWMGQYADRPYFYMDGHLGQYVIVIPDDELIIVRLGHNVDDLPRSDSKSAFNAFIRQAYLMLGDEIPGNPEL